MSIPIISFLFVYFGILVIFAFFSFFHIYHLLRYVAPGGVVYLVIILFILGSLVIIGITSVNLLGYDWSQSIDVFSVNSNTFYD